MSRTWKCSEFVAKMLNETRWNRFNWKESKKTEVLKHFLYSDFKSRISNRAESVTLFLEDLINVFKQAGNCMKVKKE